MGMSDLFEDYHPESLTMDEVHSMVEDACISYFIVHSSATDNVVVTNISPIGK